MKKIYIFIVVIGLTLALVACGSASKKENPAPAENNNEGTTGTNTNENNQNSSEPVQDSDVVNQDDLQKQMDDIDYAEFTLEVEYANQTEYEADLDKDNDDDGLIEAEIKDSINNVNLQGTEAFNELYSKLQDLTINQQTAKEEAIAEALKVFNLETAYSKFEMEITFKDGTKIEFEDRK